MASERRSRAEHQIANRRSGGYDVTQEVAEHHDKIPYAGAQRHPCDSGASGTAVAGSKMLTLDHTWQWIAC